MSKKSKSFASFGFVRHPARRFVKATPPWMELERRRTTSTGACSSSKKRKKK
jgi:hypothetical protein